MRSQCSGTAPDAVLVWHTVYGDQRCAGDRANAGRVWLPRGDLRRPLDLSARPDIAVSVTGRSPTVAAGDRLAGFVDHDRRDVVDHPTLAVLQRYLRRPVPP